MNVSDGLALAGIVATIVFGVWGLVVVLRRQYPGQLTFVKEPYIALFDSIVKNLPELAVLYNGVPVGQGLVLVKGALLNTGSKDITDSMVEQKLTLRVPSDFRWLTAKIVDSSGNVNASLAIQDSAVVFETGLFRCDEFIRFQAIAEVPSHAAHGLKTYETIEDRLDQAISITHRIADTQKVASYELPKPAVGKRRVRRYLFISIAGTAMAAVVAGLLAYKGVPADLYFTVTDANATQHVVRATPRLNGNIVLKGVDDDFREEVKVNEFFNRAPLNPKIAQSSQLKLMGAISIVFYLILPWGACALAYHDHRRSEKLRRLLGIDDLKDAPVHNITSI